MRSLPSGPKSAFALLSSMVVLCGALIVGCSSGTPSLDDPKVKQGLQVQKEAVQKQDSDASAALNKRGKGAQIKSIKSKIGAGG